MPGRVLAPSIILGEDCEENVNSASIPEAAHDTVPGLQGDKGSNEAAALHLELVLLLPPTY